jgi:hypothetical protein
VNRIAEPKNLPAQFHVIAGERVLLCSKTSRVIFSFSIVNNAASSIWKRRPLSLLVTSLSGARTRHDAEGCAEPRRGS